MQKQGILIQVLAVTVYCLFYNAYRLALRPSLFLVKNSCRYFHRSLKMTVHMMCTEQFYHFNSNNNTTTSGMENMFAD